MASAACTHCRSNPPSRAYVLPCGHSFCATCAADTLAASPKCSECGKPAATAMPASRVAGGTVTVRHRGVAFDLDLAAGEQLYPACASIWRGQRLKLVSQGKLLRTGATVPEAGGLVVQLICSTSEPRGALPPWLRLQIDEWRDSVRQALGGLLAAAPPRRDFLPALLRWLWSLCGTVGHFFLSMVSPPARPEPREGPR